MKDNKPLKISLQDSESSGGQRARAGFSFQNNLLVSLIPKWLSDESFTEFIHESMGDIEVKYFNPDLEKQYSFYLYEVKNHPLTAREFWSEIKRFKGLDEKNPNIYRHFIIASTGFADKLKPIINNLKRIKAPYKFYDPDSAINIASYNEFKDQIKQTGKDENYAELLYSKVVVEDEHQGVQHQAEAIFIQSLSDNLPEYRDLPYDIKRKVFIELSDFTNNNVNKPINRKKIEELIRSCIGPINISDYKPVDIITNIVKEDSDDNFINLDWSIFWGDDNRKFPPSEIWTLQMVWQLNKIKDWILKYRNTKRIRLSGNRRLSSSIAIGTVFSAVSGYNIDLNYRGKVWSTDMYPDDNINSYKIETKTNDKKNKEAVVSIGIINNIEMEVNNFTAGSMFIKFPTLHIKGNAPITSPNQANQLVCQIKKLINNFIIESEAIKIHLFFTGPSPLALFLGHRLNATAQIQCYEKMSTNIYHPTCLLACK